MSTYYVTAFYTADDEDETMAWLADQMRGWGFDAVDIEDDG